MNIFRVFWDTLILRCPRCHRGKTIQSWFTINRQCPVCGLVFEEASGEITGGMGVNIVAILFIVIVAAGVIGFSSVPLVPAFTVMGIFIILFSIFFYPVSRSLWIGILYITENNAEGD